MARYFRVSLPFPGTVWDALISPHGDRIGWITMRGTFSNRDQAAYDLWSSDLDGARVVHIGSQNGETERTAQSPTGERYHWPKELRWSPDGRLLSFTYPGSIWSVPAKGS